MTITQGLKRGLLILGCLFLPACEEEAATSRPGALPAPEKDSGLVQVAQTKRQWTGVAVSATGRVFVNFPRWSDDVPASVCELIDSTTLRPFPDADWNAWAGQEDTLRPQKHFVCVQSVVIDDDNTLWVLDAAGPKFQGIIEGGPKLVGIDLVDNKVVRNIPLGEVCREDSYLNDVRVDSQRKFAYITDSGDGALIVLNLKTSQAKRFFDDHPAAHAEDYTPVIGGESWGKKVHADGLALTPDGHWLYFRPLTGRRLHRVPTRYLRKEEVDRETLGKLIETLATADIRISGLPWVTVTALPKKIQKHVKPVDVGACDGMLIGPEGNVLLTSLERGAISAVTDRGVKSVVADPVLQWPDSLARAPGGWVYVTTSKIHLSRDEPVLYGLYKFKPESKK
jgi:sugar lactone lactonase YvrE